MSRFSGFWSKYAVFVCPGDAGYWFGGCFGVPLLLLYVGILFFWELVLFLSISKDKKYKDMKLLFMFVSGLLG